MRRTKGAGTERPMIPRQPANFNFVPPLILQRFYVASRATEYSTKNKALDPAKHCWATLEFAESDTYCDEAEHLQP